MRARYLLIVPVLAMALLGSGCSTVKAKLDAKFTPPTKVITQEATVAVAAAPIIGTLSKGFPPSLPLWPGAKLTKTKITKAAQGKGYSATFTTADPYRDVLAGVATGLQKAGYKLTASNGSTGLIKATVLMVTGAKTEGIVTVSQVPGKPVEIDYVVTPKKK